MKTQGGFTLLEVLVALILTGIGLAVVFQSFSQSLRLRAKAEAAAEAVQAAQRLLEDEAFLQALLSRGGGSGPIPQADPWRYRATVEPLRWAPRPGQEALPLEGMAALTLCVEKAVPGAGAPRCVTGWYRVVP